ncbi:glyoxalase [Microbacterium resistens]|uniref:VOC family protein n=1 Tax=Microbacterium resistens TaxID=156977 RepID=UPI001C5848C6|nr:VOC family protein [Microbacterium resistens]MBW1640929.1 glyoxalase [Microbacterium resistens]
MTGLHHVEIWVGDLSTDLSPWRWLRGALGFERSSEWPEGETWAVQGCYLTITRPPTLEDPAHDRRRAGVNHLAFDGGSGDEVDRVMGRAPAHGWTPLYHDRYPHAGGPSHYAGWLENGAGFKVEIVATDA